MPIKPVRDTVKWVQAARDLYYQVHKGTRWQSALQKLTENWDTMEKLDFENWLKFYEEGVQHKYKQAQMSYWGDQNNLGYYLPVPQSTKPEMLPPKLDMNTMKVPTNHPDILQEEKRKTIETQRQKILSRLDSAEKLWRAEEGHMLGGAEYESVMDALYQLKKKIQVVNKISTSVKLYQDMMIREANVLSGRGYKQASEFITKIAQAVPSVAEPLNPALVGDGQAGTLPGQAPGQVPQENNNPSDISVDPTQQAASPETPPTNLPSTSEPLSAGMQEFLAGLDHAATPISVDDNLEVNEADTEFVTEAQAAPVTIPNEPIEEVSSPSATEGDNFDKKLDATFTHLTIGDVVNKLEDLAKVFKTREIPRQIAMVDMMLDRLGWASFFPSLAEANNKALEANNYMLTRIDDILSKLRGAMETKDLDLKNDTAAPPNEMANRLQDMDTKEKAKKQMRKEIEEQNLVSKKPEATVEMKEDLAAPAKMQTPAPIPTPPVTPPTV